MYWANFLHIYQPANQMPDILKRIVNESYRPILKSLKGNPHAKITLNINAVLTELLFKKGYIDIIDDLRLLGSKGQIEFTSSAKYHAFLPLLPEKQIIRQIELNDKTNTKYLGSVYNPNGFFPPEMGYSPSVSKIVSQLGFKWIIIDEIAFNGHIDQLDFQQLYEIKNTNHLKAFFRERRTSNLIMSAVVRDHQDLLNYFNKDQKHFKYLITAMDGETFGHHRPGLEKLLHNIYSEKKFNLVTISELEQYIENIQEVKPTNSTWASSENDIKQGIQFISWQDPTNIIHKWQWLSVNHLLRLIKKYHTYQGTNHQLKEKIDASLASDQFWWASAKPWWSLEMIEEGAYKVMQSVHAIKQSTEQEKNKAYNYYQKIVLKAFEWQRSGLIRKIAEERDKNPKIPFKKRTLKQGKPEFYYAFIDKMKKRMLMAAKKQEFEKAIIWRDAINKIDNENDIYDAVHACDLLRQNMKWGELEEIMDLYKKKYKKIKSGQPEQRG